MLAMLATFDLHEYMFLIVKDNVLEFFLLHFGNFVSHYESFWNLAQSLLFSSTVTQSFNPDGWV